MKYDIGDMVADEDGHIGIVVIRWDDGDICAFENDAAHPGPRVVKRAARAVERRLKNSKRQQNAARLPGLA